MNSKKIKHFCSRSLRARSTHRDPEVQKGCHPRPTATWESLLTRKETRKSPKLPVKTCRRRGCSNPPPPPGLVHLYLITALDGFGVLSQLQVAHGEVEEGSQEEGVGGFGLFLRQAVLHFQPGHDLPVLNHRLQVFAFLGWSKEEEARGTRADNARSAPETSCKQVTSLMRSVKSISDRRRMLSTYTHSGAGLVRGSRGKATSEFVFLLCAEQRGMPQPGKGNCGAPRD